MYYEYVVYYFFLPRLRFSLVKLIPGIVEDRYGENISKLFYRFE